MFFKKEDKFFIQLKKISANLIESAHFFKDFKLNEEKDLKVFYETMKQYETKGDSYVHNIIKDLNKVFITPIEREDILSLAMHMDDVLDGLEHASSMFDMYQITQFDDYICQFIDMILNSVIEIDKAVDLLSEKKLIEIREHAINIKDYETTCDNIRRLSIKDLFLVEEDPIRLIKYKEIYEKFEDVADSCESVANTFEEIVMKNA